MVTHILNRWVLRHIFLLSVGVLPAYAGSSTLDRLFTELENVTTEAEARRLENQIWINWFKSGDSSVDDLMQTAMNKRRGYDFNGALGILNQVIDLKPEFAEAWNQRATVYFHQQQYEKSLWDIARTLELEPRHFGAMAGRGVIRLYQGKPALARQNIIEALKIHPYLKERNMFPGL